MGIQFFAADDEVRAWLREGLDVGDAPYFVAFWEQADGSSEMRWIELDAFLDDRTGFQGAHRFWIGSEALSGGLRVLESQSEALFAVNGLLLLSHGVVFKERLDSSAMAISDRFRNVDSGEVLAHSEYRRIFRRLERRIRHDLRYATIDELSGEEDDRLILMTEGAKNASESGVPFTSRPGRRLVPKEQENPPR